MMRLALALLAPLALAMPAAAQNEPFRIVNGAAAPATGLYLTRSGQEGWGRNLLRGPLAPRAALSMRPPEGAGCRFDIRLTLQDGQEAIRRDVDVCGNRVVVVADGGGATAPAAPPLPQVGGGDRFLPSVGGRD
jgi:serine protease Do